MLSDPAELARRFAALWGTRDARGIAALFAPDGEFLSLTGGVGQNPKEIAELLAGEFAGAFQRARLVTGRSRLRPIGEGAAVIWQRFVLSGLVDENGAEAGRIGAALCATLERTGAGWQIVSAQFVVEA
ncbi:SgcJ/EcaC family oxidoreductase [Rhodobacter lacus]|uniref:SgcJ/EcaC family oxidoreductase n=1 Tax=Rhodobacter lacus TaxID=1641972 RepID=A0ABW5A7V8_9RHOB